MSEPIMPVFAIERHRLLTDGIGVTTLVGAYGCPLRCKYCINPHAWNPDTLNRTPLLTPSALSDKVKIDELYFLSTGGGVTFGGGESLLHANFIRAFREVCGAYSLRFSPLFEVNPCEHRHFTRPDFRLE